MSGKQIISIVHTFCLSAIGMFLPLSEYMVSLFTILLAVNWLIGAIQTGSFRRIISNRYIWVFSVSYLVYLAWVLNTNDFPAALDAIRLKLPLLIIPVIVFTTPIKRVSVRWISYSFLLGIFIATVAGYVTWRLKSGINHDPRDISLFISHIRLSLMVIVAALLALFLIKDETNKWLKRLLLLAGLWNIVFLFLLFSFTGMAISALVITLLLTRYLFYIRGRYIRVVLITVISLLLVVVAIFINREIRQFSIMYDSEDIDDYTKTAAGNPYTHYPDRQDVESGYYVWRYICYDELSREWDRVSDTDFDGVDGKGQKLEYTLIRYLTSIGSRKDSAGIVLLDYLDIRLIEEGYANKIYRDANPVYLKFYELIWQIDYYLKGGNPQGHSVTQRIEFMKTTWRVFARYPLFGTGTGDFKNEQLRQYELDKSVLDQEFRLSTHNQYLLVLATFGIIGALLFWGGILAPIIIKKGYRDTFFMLFILIVTISMLWEDTLETHTGVTFFAFFYSVILVYKPIRIGK